MTELEHRVARRVAIIDDEQDILIYLRVALEDHGYLVVTTGDPVPRNQFGRHPWFSERR